MQFPAPKLRHVLYGMILLLVTACVQPSVPVSEPTTAPDAFCLIYEPIDATGLTGPEDTILRIDENDAKWLELCPAKTPGVTDLRRLLAALHPTP